MHSRMSHLLAPMGLLAGALLTTSALHAQGGAADAPVEVLILGSYHFDNPGLDVVKTEVADIMSAEKQREVAAVAEALARFRPTKIAVERLASSASRVDSLYAAYRAGTHQLSRSEVEQLGFRIASQLNHSRVYAVDHGGEFPFGPLMQYAQVHDTAFVTMVQREIGRITAESNRQQREYTLAQILRSSNDPEKLARDHGFYLRTNRVGAGDSYAGADLLSKWYERNIRIFANVQRMAEPGDRILLIIGSGHAPILRELVTFEPSMRLVEAIDYLPGAAPRAGSAR